MKPRDIKILLVNAEVNIAVFPIGIAYVSSALKKNGFEVHCLDLVFYLKEDYENVIEKIIRDHNIDIVGTGGYSQSFARMELIFDVARRVNSSIITILGGTLFSTLPVPVFERLDIDYGVTGEGDETIVDLVMAIQHKKDVSTVEGVYYRNADGAVVSTKQRALIVDINGLPFPDYEGFSHERYIEICSNIAVNRQDANTALLDEPRSANILASRSCPFGCTFCYHVMGRSYRKRSLDSLFAEIDHLIARYRVNIINFVDDLFFIKREDALEFCRRITPYGIQWSCQLRVSGVDADLLKLIHEAGCVLVSYGIESMSPPVLLSMKKETSIQQIEHALALTKQSKIAIQGNLIFGDPAETVDTVNQTLNWWAKNPKYQIWTTMICTHPGAPIFSKAKEKGIIADDLEYGLTGFNASRSFIINITTMDTPTFNELQLVVGNLYGLPRLPAELLEINNTGQVSRHVDAPTCESLPMVDIRVQCPECHQKLAYRRFSFLWLQRVICRECGSRIDLPLKRFLSLLVPSGHRHLLFEAQELFRMGKLAGCTGHFRQTPELFHTADGKAIYGTLLLRQGKFSEACQILGEASVIDPFTSFIENNYGVALFAVGRVGLALMRFRQAQILQPVHPNAYHNEARVYEYLGDANATVPFFIPPHLIKPLDFTHFRITIPDIRSRDLWASGIATNIALPALPAYK